MAMVLGWFHLEMQVPLFVVAARIAVSGSSSEFISSMAEPVVSRLFATGISSIHTIHWTVSPERDSIALNFFARPNDYGDVGVGRLFHLSCLCQ